MSNHALLIRGDFIQKTPILILLLAPLVGLAANLDANSLITDPPYKKRAVSALVEASALASTNAVDASPYLMTVYFTPIGGPEVGDPTAGESSVPAPVAGATPVPVVKKAGWVGAVQWREIGVDGLLKQVLDVFRDGVAYAAQIYWTPVKESASKLVSENTLQMPWSAYRPAGDIVPQQKQMAGNQSDVVVANTTSLQEGAPILASGNPLASASNNAIRKIALPDLGGEAEATLPVQKPYNPATQPTQNTPGGAPYGSSMSSPSFGGVPGIGGAQAGGGTNLAPGMNGAPNLGVGLPAINVGGANISPTATNFLYESKNYLAHLGVDYSTPQSNNGLGVKADGAALLGKTVAIGTNLSMNSNVKEAVLSGVWMPEDTNLKAKLSASYMQGQQNFNFYSGNSNATLSQASYYFSTQYVVPKAQSDYLHSLGVSTWGSKAKQTNNPDPIYSVAQTATAYQIMMDPLKLAVGTLQGEALDAQVGITKQIIAKVSAGYESLRFPFSDGTQELDKRIYQDYVVQYQPIQEVALQAGYKMGAAMNNIMLSAAYAQWKLTGFKNNGVNGVTGNQGLMLTYSLPLDGSVKSTAFGTLTRPELIGNSSYILRDAATRPVQLPQTFLAKVDTTAVKVLANISKVGLPSGATVNSAGDVLITVGAGASAITSVTRNGSAYAFSSVVQLAGQNVQLRSRLLPAAVAGGDTYVLHITDTSTPPVPYLVTVTTAN